MSNRKENLKRSLGITEDRGLLLLGAGSSDEEDDDDTQNVGSRPRQFTNENYSANSSRLFDRNNGQAPDPPPTLSPIRRNLNRIQHGLSCSSLNNPIRMSIIEPVRPGPSTFQPILSYQGTDIQSKTSYIERMLAINKLPRRVCLARSKYQSTLIPNNPHRNAPHPSRSERMPPSIDVSVPEPNLNSTARAQDSGLNHSNSDEGAEPQPENANSEMVVEVEPDMVVVDNGGADNTHNDDRTNEQANEEPSTSNNAAELQPARQGVKRRSDGDELEEDDINTSLLHLLECPVCMEWMEPPLSQCRRGHLVCGPCRIRLNACPVCRTAFSSMRNRVMESVSELLRYPCRHGCGRETRLRRRVLHEANCAARRYPCPVSPCVDQVFQLDELQHHAQACHLSILKVGRLHKFSVRLNAEQHDTWLVMAASELFHLCVDVDRRIGGRGIIVYVAYIGPLCNAKNFTYEVTVIGQHRKIVYARSTHSNLESPTVRESIRRQDCFYISLDQAFNFSRMTNRHCEPETYLDFVVNIKETEAPPAAPRDSSDS